MEPFDAQASARVVKETRANAALSPALTTAGEFRTFGGVASAFYADDRSVICRGDVTDVLRQLVATGVKVDCIVTSPPFYGQRDYVSAEQIGLEPHPRDYIEKLLETFRLCGALLRDTGSLWVNLGDTYWSGKGQHRSSEEKQSARRFGLRPQDRTGDGTWCKPKQLLLIPHRFAIAMQDDGWLVRNDNVWVKPYPVPDQVRDRCSISHEYVFHFTKNRWYYFDRAAVSRSTANGKRLPPLDTWVVPPARGNGKHRAAFSEELVRIPVLATAPPDGIVLDPFAGSGTTLAFARAHGRRSVGIDVNAAYCELARQAVLAERPAEASRSVRV